MTELSTGSALDHDGRVTAGASARFRAMVERTETWLLEGKKATYGVAVLRIGFGLILGVMLLTSYTTRHFAWGAGRDWVQPRVDSDTWWPAFDLLFGAGTAPWLFDVQYLMLIVLSILLTIGWRSRIVVPLTLIGFIALTRMNPFISDGGLQLFRITLVYLCLVDTSLRWSVDARRRALRTVEGTARIRRPRIPAWLNNLLHNSGVLLLIFQMCIIYVASSMFKIQGNLWQGGTAIYYVLQLDEFATWPQITRLVDTNGLIIGSLTYLTVFVQLFFPFLLLQRTTRILGLVVITMMHVGIGVFMGLMYFSFTMIAIDAIFIRDVTWRAAARRAAPHLRRLRARVIPVSQPSVHRAAPASTAPATSTVRSAAPPPAGAVPPTEATQLPSTTQVEDASEADAAAGDCSPTIVTSHQIPPQRHTSGAAPVGRRETAHPPEPGRTIDPPPAHDDTDGDPASRKPGRP